MCDIETKPWQGVRIVYVHHVASLINSASHVWGKQAWNTGDLSKNNWWLALISLGESWHNNHHAFEYSARHGLEWWQFDLTWYVIKFLQIVGLITDVKLPSQEHKQKMTFNN
ncbi:FATTY ACID DESATURASE B, fatty acid desaturase 5 [Hibiscus trionum]|uniref:FATTY ACID DESATURASE B, fatty acid desaturase 5 n=1 Tax=Hibiscus trionum TaxID=183268 RepID=A0A9W7IAM1_HIBTR|nr:FATTY ACID DESATURASE B, fatty acid desaturase 5 [Hibiscus trionum]